MRKPRTITCGTCGKEFLSVRAEYCSRRCAAIGRHEKLGHAPAPITCPTCGKTVTLRGYLAKVTKYCSRACYRDRPVRYSRTFACARCGKELPRGVRGKRATFCSVACRSESARKGGSVSSQGYRVQSVGGKPILEHRLVMERRLGRPLLTSESVHHLNGDRLDNADGNLELWWKGQVAGQRVSDLIAYVVNYHRTAIMEALHVTPPS